jgi:hypothetical protein
METFILLLLVALAAADDGHKIDDTFEFMVHTKDQFNLSTNNAGSVTDPYNNIMVGLENGTIFTRADADNIVRGGLSWYWCQFGLNFSAGIQVPGGIKKLPGVAVMIPYQSGVNKAYRLLYSSRNLKVYKDQDWYIFDSGTLVLFQNNGTFTGGVMAGTTYKNQSIVAYTVYVYIRELRYGEVRGLDDIRIIRTVNREPSYSIPNEIGGTSQLLLEQCYDERSRIGENRGVVTVTRRPVSIQRTRVVITFNYTEAADPGVCDFPWIGERWTGLQTYIK